MQLLTGADLPHTHARLRHWIATAAALAAVVAAAALIQPADAATPSDPGPSAGPDPAAVRYPVRCAGERPEVVERYAADLDRDGRAETVAMVRCRAAGGTPPSGLYVIARPAGRDGTPRIAETLLDPGQRLSVGDITVRGDTIEATLFGYSSSEVPRCCPDQARAVSWQWRDGRFVREAEPVAGASV